MQKTAVKIGPADHGRRMSLAEFDHAEVQEGYLYELSRGIITVSDVPNPPHLVLVTAIKRPFHAYDLAHPGIIFTIATGSECKLLVWDFESERHPDLAIYKTPPPKKDFWTKWIPDLVLEIVSRRSEKRDYEQKPEEYLRFGVKEYWIVDADKQQMLVLTRRSGKWTKRVVKPSEVYQTKLLPGFEFNLGAVFEAAKATER